MHITGKYNSYSIIRPDYKCPISLWPRKLEWFSDFAIYVVSQVAWFCGQQGIGSVVSGHYRVG